MACCSCRHSVRVVAGGYEKFVCSLYSRETPFDYGCAAFSAASARDLDTERQTLRHRPAPPGRSLFVGEEPPAGVGPLFDYAILIVNRVR